MSIYFLENIKTDEQIKQLYDVTNESKKMKSDLENICYQVKEENIKLNNNKEDAENAANKLVDLTNNAKGVNNELEENINETKTNISDLNNLNSLSDKKNNQLLESLKRAQEYISSLKDSENLPKLALEIERLKKKIIISEDKPDDLNTNDIWIDLE